VRFRVRGSGFRVQRSGFRVRGSGFRVRSSGFGIQGSVIGFQGSVFRVKGSQVRCLGFGVWEWGSGVGASEFRVRTEVERDLSKQKFGWRQTGDLGRRCAPGPVNMRESRHSRGSTIEKVKI